MLNFIAKDSSQRVEVDGEQLGKLINFRYLPHLEFAHWKLESQTKTYCKHALKRGRISQLAIWLGQLHEKELQEALIPSITIKEAHPEVGYGVFTDEKLPKWHFIGEYTGVVRGRGLFFFDLNDYCFAYPREWFTLYPLTIDGCKEGNFTRFINHSDRPNLESVAVLQGGIFHILFRTLCEIEAGNELTYNYGEVYWRERTKLNYA